MYIPKRFLLSQSIALRDNIIFTLTENIGFKRKSVFVIILLIVVVSSTVLT